MQGRPALVVRLVHRGALLHQEVHHLQVLINAGLGAGARPSALPHPGYARPASRTPEGLWQTPGIRSHDIQGKNPDDPGRHWPCPWSPLQLPSYLRPPGLPKVRSAGHLGLSGDHENKTPRSLQV